MSHENLEYTDLLIADIDATVLADVEEKVIVDMWQSVDGLRAIVKFDAENVPSWVTTLGLTCRTWRDAVEYYNNSSDWEPVE